MLIHTSLFFRHVTLVSVQDFSPAQVSLDQEKNGKKAFCISEDARGGQSIHDEENEFLTNLSRAAHFGERSLLRAALSNTEQHASRSMIGDVSAFRKKCFVC